MQIHGLHKNLYTLSRYACEQGSLDVHRRRYEGPVRDWKLLKAESVPDAKCQAVIGISRATFYRYKAILAKLAQGLSPPSKRPRRVNKPRWGEAERQLVLRIRRENPTYGKEKIAVIMGRDHGTTLSAGTVGRILTTLFQKGLITRSASAPRVRRRRKFGASHAHRWTYKDYSKMQLGERVQIDHMTVTRNSVTCKHFQAWERRSKFIHAQVYSHAKASSAKRFLMELIEQAPFPILSIQVDGGAEFMAEFEEACAEKSIPLEVLPPTRPTYNGGVERGNRTFREEFYQRRDLLADSIGAMRCELKAALAKYNGYRPHQALAGLTPIAYIHKTRSGNAPQSQTI